VYGRACSSKSRRGPGPTLALDQPDLSLPT